MRAELAATVATTMPAIKPVLGDFDFDTVIAWPVGVVETVWVITTPLCVTTCVDTIGVAVDVVLEEV
jgi:hypothetical protein